MIILNPAAYPVHLPHLRIANRQKHEYSSACPFCGGDHHSDRFRIWFDEHPRYWCRQCNSKGSLASLIGMNADEVQHPRQRRQRALRRETPNAANIAHYRAIYAFIAAWAHANLLDPSNPEALAYLHQRGLNETTIREAMLGVTYRDPSVLPALLKRERPDLLPFAEAAGVLRRLETTWETHPNLCGMIVFPYRAEVDGTLSVVDLRTRRYPGKGYRSLAGGYEERGATFPFGWETLVSARTEGVTSVVITEGEIKALALQQAAREHNWKIRVLAHPGITSLPKHLLPQITDHGITRVIFAYDSQPRPTTSTGVTLSVEERWSIKHGISALEHKLQTHVLRLPLGPTETKTDLDEFLLKHGAAAMHQRLVHAAELRTFVESLPSDLVEQAKLDLPDAFPLRRPPPRQIAPIAPRPNLPIDAATLARVRQQIADSAEQHVREGQGLHLLAHPPGTGKGHNTALGVQTALANDPTNGQIVWTAPRKDQRADQPHIALELLQGRNANNCQRLGEATTLAAKGYNVRSALCQRRCPHLDYCDYLRQFSHEGHMFAAQPLLNATHWWDDARAMVLDEFDYRQLIRTIKLTSADLATILSATPQPHLRQILSGIAQLMGSCLNRTLSGALLIDELRIWAETQQGLNLTTLVEAAIAELPAQEDVHRLADLPRGATMRDFLRLPPNYTHTIVTQIQRDLTRSQQDRPFTSRLHLRNGTLVLFQRAEHVIAQLARADQPKLILDATANLQLLKAIFPATPISEDRPHLPTGVTVHQVIDRDWSKSTLRYQAPLREAWYNEVAGKIRPNRPTLVICTTAEEVGLREALKQRGHEQVIVRHYGAIRGSNEALGYDVILAQIYHPNLAALLDEAICLFADDPEPLDPTMVMETRNLVATDGTTYTVHVPVFADARLTALLEQHRESELLQSALRGRPADHPDVQITVLFSMPIPHLPPTTILQRAASPLSNRARSEAAQEAIAMVIIDAFAQPETKVLSIATIAAESGTSETTVRKYLPRMVERLGLKIISQRRSMVMPKGGERSVARVMIMRKGRYVPPMGAATNSAAGPEPIEEPAARQDAAANSACAAAVMIKHAHKKNPITRVIHHSSRRKRRLCWLQPRQPPRLRGAPPAGNSPRQEE